VLELPMGVLSAYLPTEKVWRLKAPEWARDLWPELEADLKAWCRANHAAFYVYEFADFYQLSTGPDTTR
jgi:hypothetical protein